MRKFLHINCFDTLLPKLFYLFVTFFFVKNKIYFELLKGFVYLISLYQLRRRIEREGKRGRSICYFEFSVNLNLHSVG